jgi:hypothetical protein
MRTKIPIPALVGVLVVVVLGWYFNIMVSTINLSGGSVASSIALRRGGASVTRIAWKPPPYKTKYPRGYLVEQPQCPGRGTSPIGEASIPSHISEDHVLVGVTCIPRGTSTWECRDCGLDCQFTSWSDCPLVTTKGICEPFGRANWDEPPRSFSQEPPEPRVTHSHVHFLTHKGMVSWI